MLNQWIDMDRWFDVRFVVATHWRKHFTFWRTLTSAVLPTWHGCWIHSSIVSVHNGGGGAGECFKEPGGQQGSNFSDFNVVKTMP